MKRVILIDDEPMVLESIRAGVDWKKLDIQVCAQFNNAMEALEYVQQNPVDIVVTDITMPPFSGLMLCARIQKLRPEVRFIIISGYADFAYAQKAMQFGAVGYCLKPIDYNELCGYLKKAAGAVNISSPAYEFIESLYENNEDQLRDYLSSLKIREPFYMAVSTGQHCLNDLFSGFCCSIGLHEYLYLSNEPLPVLLKAERLAGKKLRGVAVGSEPAGCDRLRDLAFQLMYDSYQFFFQSEQTLFHTHSAYCEGLVEETRQVLHQPTELERLLFAQRGRINHILQAAEIYNLIYQAAGGEGNLYTYKQLAFSFRDYDDMVTSLMELVRSSYREETVTSSNRSFLNIIKYIHENYTSDISVKTIADQFYMNPCYISQLFKKETGKTFVKYLTGLRINRAEELLSSTELTINKISEECGFNDPFYFIKIFKKYTGRAPSDFRKHSAVCGKDVFSG